MNGEKSIYYGTCTTLLPSLAAMPKLPEYLTTSTDIFEAKVMSSRSFIKDGGNPVIVKCDSGRNIQEVVEYKNVADRMILICRRGTITPKLMEEWVSRVGIGKDGIVAFDQFGALACHYGCKGMINESYDYSSTQINVIDADRDLYRKLYDYVRNIPEDILYYGDDRERYGRETESHITVLYGLHTTNPEDVMKIVKGFGPIIAKLGKISKFECDKYDVIKVDINSPQLHSLNVLLSKLDNTNDYDTYKPHMTLAYVQKGRGNSFVGDSEFEGLSCTFDKLIFSSKGGTKTAIYLT